MSPALADAQMPTIANSPIPSVRKNLGITTNPLSLQTPLSRQHRINSRAAQAARFLRIKRNPLDGKRRTASIIQRVVTKNSTKHDPNPHLYEAGWPS
jgi:hypothetical protein